MAHPRILVVEDHREVQQVLKKFLRQMGCETDIQRDGHAALSAAKRARPDLVLLDMRLPGLDGGEILPKLRKVRGLGDVPVIGMSGYAHDAMRREALERGCTRFLEKPIRLDALRTAIVELLGYEPEPFPD